MTAMTETEYLNSIPNLVDSIIDTAKEPLKDCAIYEQSEEW